ncbi:MAG: hypothetical protein AAF203_03050, partial [Pseudomonadota bacterium]
MKNTYRIAEIYYGSSKWGVQYSFETEQSRYEVQRFGINFDVGHAKYLMRSLRSDVDAFCLSDFPSRVSYHNRSFVHRQYLELRQYPVSIPVCDGNAFRELLMIDGLNRKIESGEIEPQKGVFFPSGLMHLDVVKELRNRYEKSLYFADAFMTTGLPLVRKPGDSAFGTQFYLYLTTQRDLGSIVPDKNRYFNKLSHSIVLEKIKKCESLFSTLPTLLMFDNVSDV